MAHEIETMMFSGETPWHKLGKEIKKEQGANLDLCLKAAGLDWEVEKTPLAAKDTNEVVPGFFGIRRSTDQKILGVVRGRYEPLQNSKAFEWFQPWLDQKQALIHTAGSLAGGQRVWVLAEIIRAPMEIVKNDFIKKFLFLGHGHDGKTCIRAGLTPIRVVCANTEAMAINHSQSQLIRVNHTGKTKESLDAIRDTVNLIDQSFEATAKQYRLLAKKTISQEDVKKYVKLVLGIKEAEPVAKVTKTSKTTKTAKAKVEEQEKEKGEKEKLIADILARIETGKGNDMPGVRGTLWGAYNGVTDWLSHGKARTEDRRMQALWMGQSMKINQRALTLALAMVS